MSSELQELYRETILDHARRPRNFRELPGSEHQAEGYNPLCGDRLKVFVDVDHDAIREITFTGEGCAICMASASLMTQHLKGVTTKAAGETFLAFKELVMKGHNDADGLGKLVALAGVSKYPMRVKCATLAWHTMKAALGGRAETISTE